MRRHLRNIAVAILFMSIWPAVAQGQNVLTLHCPYSHTRQADPIVSFGIFPSAHNHDFFGSDTTDEFSTSDSLVGTSTSCKTSGDTAAYWFPQPLWNGSPIQSSGLGEYWQRPTGVVVATPPHGMSFVAGNSHALSAADNPNLRWTCGDGTSSTAPRNCTGSTGGSNDVTAVLTFPMCWDGTTDFDATGGISPSHFVYPGKSCPAGTRPIAKLVTHTHFKLPGAKNTIVNPFNPDGSLALSFSSGPYYTYHGDFRNGWVQSALDALMQGCVNKIGSCPPHA